MPLKEKRKTRKKPRILLYSHDTYGLGHLRRTLTIAHQIADTIPGAHQLLLTGSTVAGAFGLPPRLDMVKLPALSKRSSGQYKSRALPLTLRQTLGWREEMILQSARIFQPDLVLVDKVAAGVHGELLPTLRYLKTWAPDTKIVLGMRDIEDSPTVTRAEWHENGVLPLLENVYDRILLYGPRDVFDPLTAYDLPDAIARKVVECGYLHREARGRSGASVRRELGIGDRPLVVATVGGGGDGYDILSAALEMEPAGSTPYHLVLVTGPLMPQRQRRALRRAAADRPVTLIEFTPHLPAYLEAADVVISMAGYNTVCELLSLRKRAILIPRVRVRVEQQIRAARLAARGLVQTIDPHDLTPRRLARAVDAALTQSVATVLPWKLEGQVRAGQALAALLDGEDDGDAADHGAPAFAAPTPLSVHHNGTALAVPTQEVKS